DRQGPRDPVGRHRQIRDPESLADAVEIDDGGNRFAAADERERDDRRVRLQGDAGEAGAETDEAVALVVELGRSAGTFGEHEQEAIVFEQADAVLRQPRHLPDAVGERREERDLLEELRGHALRQARARRTGAWLRNSSGMPGARRGGSGSKNIAAITRTASVADPPA